jgi:hypothetical protein
MKKIAITLAGAMLACAALAQQQPPETTSARTGSDRAQLLQRIEQMEAQLRELKHLLPQADEREVGDCDDRPSPAPAAAAVQPATTAWGQLQQVQQRIGDLQRQQPDAERRHRCAGHAAERADRALDAALRAHAAAPDAEAVARAARVATAARDQEMAADNVLSRIRSLLRSERQQLRLLASDLPRCQGQKQAWSCLAERELEAETIRVQVAAKAAEAASAADVGKPPRSERQRMVERLFAAAASAHDRVDKANTALGDLHAGGDAAARTVFSEVPADKAPAAREKSIGMARTSFQAGFEVADALRDARRAANDLSRAALRLRLQPACVPTGAANDLEQCPGSDSGAWEAATEASMRLDQALAQAAAQQDDGKVAGFTVAAAVRFDTVEAQRRAVAFQRLLDRYPDARSLVGGPSYLLSASKDGTSAAIKLSLDHPGADWLRRTTVSLATPSAGHDRATLASADGLARSHTVTLAREFTSADQRTPRLPGFAQTLSTWGGAVTLGRERRSYFEAGKLDKAVEHDYTHWGLSLYASLFPAFDSPSVHLVKLSVQRAFKDNAAQLVCPAAPKAGETTLACIEGSFGEPQRGYKRLISYEYRWQGDDIAASPRFTYNHTDGVKALDLPLYLIRADTAERPFNAGVSLGYTSRSRQPGSEAQFGFGVFVGAPLDLFSGSR